MTIIRDAQSKQKYEYQESKCCIYSIQSYSWANYNLRMSLIIRQEVQETQNYR